MTLKVNDAGRRIGLRAGDAKKLQQVFDAEQDIRQAIEALKACEAEGCEDRAAVCDSCIQTAEVFLRNYFEKLGPGDE